MHLQKINDSGLLIAFLMFIDFIKATVAQTVNAPVQIRHLVQQLPAIYKNCRANNTIKKYQEYLTHRENGQPTLMSVSCQVTRFTWDSIFFKKCKLDTPYPLPTPPSSL